MKPFAYQAPTSIDEAVALLADKGRQARPLAGGTDLLVQWRRGLVEPDLVVDVKRIPELAVCRRENEWIAVMHQIPRISTEM